MLADRGSSSSPAVPAATARTLAPFVFALFFIFGGITSLNDVLIPKLKGLFALDYREAMLVQFAFFISYLLTSVPAGFLVARIGYMRAATIGLVTMAAGCLLFLPAARSGLFPSFLGALFVVAAGITIIQVVANPLISLLGPPATASSRLTFAQAFNSLGTTVMPYIGALLILGSVANTNPAKLSGDALASFRIAEARTISHTYIGLALVLLLVAGVVWTRRSALGDDRSDVANPLAALDLLKRTRFAFGMACIFLYVGAEVSIGSILTNWLTQPTTLALDPQTAGKHLSYYWGGAMVGRFIGAGLLRLFSPGKVLSIVALIALALLALAANSAGATAGWGLIAVGLFNAIMFPTIFSLANEGLGPRAAEGSGLICVAIFGGAVLPPLTGWAADRVGLAAALWVPAVSYAVIAAFGWSARRPVAETRMPAARTRSPA